MDEIAEEYLECKAQLDILAAKVKGLKDDLDAGLHEGQVVQAHGRSYVWKVSRGRSPKYKDLLLWIESIVPSDILVMIDEQRDRFVGARVTKSLAPVD